MGKQLFSNSGKRRIPNVPSKTDIVFFQQMPFPYTGILSLTARLQKAGKHCEVIIDPLEKDSIKTICRLNPRLIGISLMSTEHQWLKTVTALLKKALPDTPVIAGGIHAILYSKEILEDTQVDIVCNSEGEAVMEPVLDALEKNQNPDWSSIQGITYRDKNQKIIINERAPLLPYCDEIMEKRDIYYDRYPVLAKDKIFYFFSSRGCPFKCSFCYNAHLLKIYHGKGIYLRQKSVKNLIDEIVYHRNKHNFKSIWFMDDLFGYNANWLREFLKEYKKKINLPFFCMGRSDLLNEERAKMLGDAKCRFLSTGIETGNENLRLKVLQKRMSNEKIIKSGQLLLKYGVYTQTSNMFCLPDETIEDAIKTIELNIKAKTKIAFSMLFMPFPHTELANYCIKKGYLDKRYTFSDIPASSRWISPLKIKDKKKIINAHYLCYIFVRYPVLFRLFKNLIYIERLNKVFYIVFIIGCFLRYKDSFMLSWPEAILLGWRKRKMG